MINFPFRVNSSFLNKNTHPITIPRGEVSYRVLESAELHREQYIIIYPKGERVPGHMYSGVAGRGPYYQLTVRAAPRDVPSYLKLNDKLLVLLVRRYAKNYAILEFRE